MSTRSTILFTVVLFFLVIVQVCENHEGDYSTPEAAKTAFYGEKTLAKAPVIVPGSVPGRSNRGSIKDNKIKNMVHQLGKGMSKGGPQYQVQEASPPPPPPPMLMAPQMIPQVPPWTPQMVPTMPSMPYMPPARETAHQQPGPTAPTDPSVKIELLAEMKAQQKLSKICKAAKKEDNLSPEFQAPVHEEQKKDNKECGCNMQGAVTALQTAKKDVLEIENARVQLMSQWRLFLQHSVAKWQRVYCSVPGLRECLPTTASTGHYECQESSEEIRHSQEKSRCSGHGGEEIHTISDDETEEMEQVELPTDENAQRIQEGMAQVVSSLQILSESAEKLEPHAKRQRKEGEDQTTPGGGTKSSNKNVSFAAHHVVISIDQGEEIRSPATITENYHGFAVGQCSQSENRAKWEVDFPPCIAEPRHHPTFQVPSGDTGGSFAEHGSSSSRQPSHFLDRRLPPEMPNYLHNLQHLWSEREDRVEDGEFYILRTWFVHHEHDPQCRVPRRVELEGDGSNWHQDIVSVWRDKLRDQEGLTIAVVYPYLRHFGTGGIVHGDIILYQGPLEFCRGLTTVYHNRGGDAARYAWAVSYPQHVSGHALLAGVEALQWLPESHCDIYHDWTPIPATSTPTHWMVHGHSFVAIFREDDLSQPDQNLDVPDRDDVQEEQAEEEPSPEASDADYEEEEMQGSAPAERQVGLLPQQIDRSSFLQALNVQEYCTWQDDKCQVHHNNVIWALTDRAGRQVAHGDYFRIELPPAEGLEIDTQLAVRIAQECEAAPSQPFKKRRTSKSRSPDRPSGSYASGAELLQVTLQKAAALFAVPPRCRHHSATFSSLRVPPRRIDSPSQPRLPVQSTDESEWLLPVGMLFIEKAVAEYEDEGPVLHLNTWFLHARRYTRGHQSREYSDSMWSSIFGTKIFATFGRMFWILLRLHVFFWYCHLHHIEQERFTQVISFLFKVTMSTNPCSLQASLNNTFRVAFGILRPMLHQEPQAPDYAPSLRSGDGVTIASALYVLVILKFPWINKFLYKLVIAL
eukprot:s676_g11.t1